jgi:hypothetical protein
VKQNEAEAKIMKSVIDFMIKHVTHEILYARAIDSKTVAMLHIWFDLANADLSLWGLHIIDANATDDDRALVDGIFSYLRENDTTGLTCSIKLADTDAKVYIQLTQMEA